LNKVFVTEEAVACWEVNKQLECVLTDQSPSALETVDEEENELLRLEEVFLCQKVDWWEDLGHSQMVCIVTKEVLDHLEHLKEWQSRLNWLINVKVLSTVFDDSFKESYK